MAATMVGRTPELGFHVVSMDGTPPPAPVTPEPPVEPPQDAPPDDAAGQPASPDAATGDPPAAPDEEEHALSDTQPRATRPFVARTLRENQSLRDQVARQEAQLAYLTEQLQRSAAPPQGRVPAPQPPQPPSALRPPRAEDYGEDTAAFSQALEQYWRGMSREETLAALRERDEQLMQQQVATLHEQVSRRVVEGRRKYEDFDEAIASLNATLQGSELFGVLKQHVAQSPHGVELLRHLGLHPDVLQEFTYRTPQGAVQYLTTLEAQLGQTPPSSQRPRTPATNGAAPPSLPPPVRPLNGGGGIARPQGSTPADIANGTGNFTEYVRVMRQQEQQRGIRR